MKYIVWIFPSFFLALHNVCSVTYEEAHEDDNEEQYEKEANNYSKVSKEWPALKENISEQKMKNFSHGTSCLKNTGALLLINQQAGTVLWF